jgi:tetratricopeptide (TPR) repeat protein
MAQGRWRAARRELGALDRFPAQMQYLTGAETRAALAVLPFLPLRTAEWTADRAALGELLPIASIDSHAPHWHAPQAIYVPHRHYLVGLLSLRLGDSAAAQAAVERLERYAGSPDDSAMARRLARGVRARMAWAGGRLDEALRVLSEPGVWPDRRLPRLDNHAKNHERFLYAELLHGVGRRREALRWYATFPDPSGSDMAYLAPSHLRRAEIFDAIGQRDSAAVHYRRVVALWRDADPELRPVVERVTRRLAALEGAGRRTSD